MQERFRIATELAELADLMLRQRLRRQHPEADEAFLNALVLAWKLDRPLDAPGREKAWPP